jgi:hypothetical protein
VRTSKFSVIATGLYLTADDYESRFYDGGCDDAAVSFQGGLTVVDFSRSALSMEEAVGTVVAAGASVIRLELLPGCC